MIPMVASYFQALLLEFFSKKFNQLHRYLFQFAVYIVSTTFDKKRIKYSDLLNIQYLQEIDIDRLHFKK